MAFFDEAGRKIKEAGQDVAQTTRNLTSTMKLNSAIADDEKNITRLYCAIGQEYFNLHGDEPEEALAAHVESIKAAKAHIEECKAQLLKIKGHILCPNCGEEITEDSVFCNFCGVKLPVKELKAEEVKELSPVSPDDGESAEEDKPLICPECGAEYKLGSMFCMVCGRPVGELPTKKVEEAPQYPSYCLHCGASIPAGVPVCPACGMAAHPPVKEASAKPYPTMKASDRTDGKPFPTMVASERADNKTAYESQDVVEEAKAAVEALSDEVCDEAKNTVSGIMEEPPAAPTPDLEKLYEETAAEAQASLEAHGAPLNEDEIKQQTAAAGEEIRQTFIMPEKPAYVDKIPPECCGGPIPGYTFESLMAKAFADGIKPGAEADHMLDGPGSEMPHRCDKCGALLKPDQKFCIMCGERVSPPEDPNVKKCSLCGAELTPGHRFCTVCGTRIEG